MLRDPAFLLAAGGGIVERGACVRAGRSRKDVSTYVSGDSNMKVWLSANEFEVDSLSWLSWWFHLGAAPLESEKHSVMPLCHVYDARRPRR